MDHPTHHSCLEAESFEKERDIAMPGYPLRGEDHICECGRVIRFEFVNNPEWPTHGDMEAVYTLVD